MESQQQQEPNSTPQRNGASGNGSASAPGTQKRPAGAGQPLSPLKMKDKTLEADEAQFTEAFVKRLTPRSSEALRLLGVLPEELVLRSYEHFYEHGISPAIQKLRYQDYEQLRQETIAMVREERATLIAQGWSPDIAPAAKLKIQTATLKAMMLPTESPGKQSRSNTTSPARGRSAAGTRRGSFGNSPLQPSQAGQGKLLQKSATEGNLGRASSARPGSQSRSPSRNVLLPHLLPEELLLEQEQERLRKVMMRQNKEIESMMAYELKLAQMMARQQQKQELRAQKEAEQAAARREERFRQAEKRRLFELQKLEEEEKLKQANAQSMARLNAQEQKHMAELAAREAERRREAERKAAERRKKKMELELRAQQNLEHQMQLARERERDMAERDRRRKQQLEEKKARLAEEHAAQKREAERRVQSVLEANARALEDKRTELQRRMDEQEARLRQFEALKAQIAQEKAEEVRQKEERRLAALQDSKAQLEGRIEGILTKKEKHEQLKEELEAKAREQHTLKMELRRLNKIRKQANIARLQRMQDYHRRSLHDKLNDERQRLAELEGHKRELLAKRQQQQISMFRQKEQLLKLFSDMSNRRNWDSLSKLQMGASGDASERSGKTSLSVSSPLQLAASHGRGDSDDEEQGSRMHRRGGSSSGGGSTTNLLGALQSLNKLASKEKAKAQRQSPQKKASMEGYMANMQKSRSGML